MAEFRRSNAYKIKRVLIVDPYAPTAKMLANLLRTLAPSAVIFTAADEEHAFALAGQVSPHVIFVEAAVAQFKAAAFVRKFRRSDNAAREAPIIMVFGDVTATQIIEARDAGVHELIRRPFTLGDIQKRLDAVSGRPRDWIEAVQYVGPDRRRFNSVDYKGPRKRRADKSNKGQKLEQALQIVRSAIQAIESDPAQARRALATQARALIDLSTGDDLYRAMSEAAAAMEAYLAAAKDGLSKAQVDVLAANIFNAAPPELFAKAA